MRKFTVEEVKNACGGKYIKSGTGDISRVVIDSRQAEEGALFVPVKGERVDGHDYIKPAFEKGAAASLCERDTAADGTLIRVHSTVDAIGKIAHAYKMKYNIPTVGVTGSVGKTTTKDMIAAVMSKLGPCLKTEGNFNNELGLPLTVFGLEEYHKSAVLEMGMSAPGEIHHLADIARPDVGVITNVGMSHIENLGSREGILRAKMEITDFFDESKLLIINNDNDMLGSISRDTEYKILTVGIENQADYTAREIKDYGIEGCEFIAVTPKESFRVRVRTAGVHNVYNALSAVAVGEHFAVPAQDIADAVESFELTAMRMTVEKMGGITLINDCYNASPDSIRASLKVLAKAAGRRVAVLGDVLELGGFAEEAHLDIGKMCAGSTDMLICAGENAKFIADGAKKAGAAEVMYFGTTEAAAIAAADTVCEGDTVLVKASRGMGFEKVCKAIGEKVK